ncbi:hypothetical protein [Kitasatospora sp. NPDC094015]|uniref:hypothetical protein n=1 Tax=Kitasatospora sp. NPDC094015 TaxID=3155205 RepID=UPI00332F366B
MGTGSTFGTDNGVGSTIALLEATLPEVREQRRRLEAELAAVTAQETAIVGALEGLAALAGTPVPAVGTATDATADATADPAVDATVGQDGDAAQLLAPVRAMADALAPVFVPAPAVAEPEPVRRSAAKRPAAAKKSAPRKAAAPAKKPATRKAEAPAKPAKQVAAKQAVVKKAAEKAVPAQRKAPAKALAKAPAKAPVKAATEEPSRRRLTDTESLLAVLADAEAPLRAREVTTLLGIDPGDANVNAVRTRLERLAKSGRANRTGRGLYTTPTA